MELTAIGHKLEKSGNTEFSAAAGKTVKIETSPGGEDILSATVPAGKVWAAHVTVYIEESDA
jgi:hypothetical protein|tara:strand:- start:2007 stop:2192 length:186 start_codon:yes stop_codon:yes gene_type:complete